MESAPNFFFFLNFFLYSKIRICSTTWSHTGELVLLLLLLLLYQTVFTTVIKRLCCQPCSFAWLKVKCQARDQTAANISQTTPPEKSRYKDKCGSTRLASKNQRKDFRRHSPNSCPWGEPTWGCKWVSNFQIHHFGIFWKWAFFLFVLLTC